MILNLFHRYGDPADPTRASYRSICGVAFQSSLCSLRDDPTSYQTVSRNGDSLHCLVKNCGLRWCEGYHRWATSTEELLTQGFPVGPIIKARYAAAVALGQRPEDEICCSFIIQRDDRTPWKIKAAGGNTVHPQCSALCVLWTLCHVRGSGTCLSRSQSGTSTTTLSSPSKSSSGIVGLWGRVRKLDHRLLQHSPQRRCVTRRNACCSRLHCLLHPLLHPHHAHRNDDVSHVGPRLA